MYPFRIEICRREGRLHALRRIAVPRPQPPLKIRQFGRADSKYPLNSDDLRLTATNLTVCDSVDVDQDLLQRIAIDLE